MLSLLLYKQRHLRDKTRRKHLSFFLNVCVHIQYIYIYIYTHTRVCPVTLASTLSVPGAAPRPPSLLYVRGARYQLCGVEARYDAPLNCLRRQSITLYMRAREYARCVWRSIDGLSFFLSNSTGDRSYARSPFVPLVGVAKSFRRRRSAKSHDTITRTRHDHRCC